MPYQLLSCQSILLISFDSGYAQTSSKQLSTSVIIKKLITCQYA